MMNFPQEHVETADLVVAVNPDGVYRWLSKRSADQVVNMLRDIADEIETDSFAAMRLTSPQGEG